MEKRYVSRVGVLPNILVLGLLAYPIWSETPECVQVYVAIGILFGVHVTEAYLIGTKIRGWVNLLLYRLYDLKSILGIYVTYLLLGVSAATTLVGVMLSAALWYSGTRYLDDGLRFRFSPFP
jgi:hypothetical protein